MFTKLRNTGWEADRLFKNTVTAEFQTPSHPIIITGYAWSLAMIPSDTQIFGTLQSAQVLWWCLVWGVQDPDEDWGSMKLTDNGLKLGATLPKRRLWQKAIEPTVLRAAQNLHGGDTAPNILSVAILKASPWTSAVNLPLHMTGMRLRVPPKCTIQMFAGHAGAGPIDFEVQGGVTYERVPPESAQ